MKRCLLVPLLFACSLGVAAQERDRSRIPDQYKWNLADLYPSDAAWRTAKDTLAAELPQLTRFEGKLTQSATALADALDYQTGIEKEFARLSVYAGLIADQDSRDSSHQAMRLEMTQLAATYGAMTAYVEPGYCRPAKTCSNGSCRASRV